MQLKAKTTSLLHCLEIAEKALPTRSSLPFLNNIFLEVGAENIYFYATNLEMSVRITMSHNSEYTKGKILLPPKIVDVIRYFPHPEVTIDIDWDNYHIKIYGEKSNFNLIGVDAEDYPVSSFDLGKKEQLAMSINQDVLKNTLKSVIFAASSDETKPAFNGIYFNFNDNTLKLNSSDTYRLVVKSLNNDNWQFDHVNCLVPARVLRELMRIVGDDDSEVMVKLGEKTMSIAFEDIVFNARLLEEKYPDVGGVIPLSFKTRVVIDRKNFEQTINRAALLAEGKNMAVNLALNGDLLEAKVRSQQGTMEEQIPVSWEGEDIDLYVNTRYILDVLKAIDENKIIIDFHGKKGPVIFRLVDDDSYLYLVLPVTKVV